MSSTKILYAPPLDLYSSIQNININSNIPDIFVTIMYTLHNLFADKSILLYNITIL